MSALSIGAGAAGRRFRVPGRAGPDGGHTATGGIAAPDDVARVSEAWPVDQTGAAAAEFLPRADLGRLLDALRNDGRRVIAPTVDGGIIVHREVSGVADLPVGRRSDQRPGAYRLTDAGHGRIFDYGIGPGSWKAFVYPPTLDVSRAERGPDGGLAFAELVEEAPRLALVGVRACELAALGILDRAVQTGPIPDSDEARRRAAVLTIGVECAVAGSTCFCTSMGTGPALEEGFDIALTELDDGFVLRTGSPAGAAVAARLRLRPATSAELGARHRQLDATRNAMPVAVDTAGLPGRLRAAAGHPRWAEIAERCLACGNCTLVCPTCFCTSFEQRTDLDVTEAVSERRWDSCFTASFAAVAGGSFRPQVAHRYRQWLTHKFGTWPEQFGGFGCVGCGRCVTWCPVGIDIREELAFIAPRAAAAAGPTVPAATPAFALAPAGASASVAAPSMPSPAVQPVPHADLPSVTWPFTPARVVSAAPEAACVTTLRLEVPDPAIRAGLPGQFVMAALPGFPPSAISISRYHPDGIDLTVRAAGPATTALGALQPGDQCGLRGPLGRPWPVAEAEGRDVLIVAGGIGLAPLRPVVDAVTAHPERFGRMHICYGAKTPSDLMYAGETRDIERSGCADMAETVDRADESWHGPTGLVTCLLDDPSWDMQHLVAFVCGPERMMTVVARTLLDRGVPRERIFLTLERHMECGVGQCGHCQVGPYFVCRDGPVFSLPELDGVFGVEGL